MASGIFAQGRRADLQVGNVAAGLLSLQVFCQLFAGCLLLIHGEFS